VKSWSGKEIFGQLVAVLSGIQGLLCWSRWPRSIGRDEMKFFGKNARFTAETTIS